MNYKQQENISNIESNGTKCYHFTQIGIADLVHGLKYTIKLY